MKAVILLLLAICVLQTQVFGRFKPYDTSDPNPQRRRHITHPKPVSSFFASNLKKPYPTNAWWLNLVLANGDQTISTFPYLTKAKSDKMCFTSPAFIATKDYVLTTFTDEWCMSLPGSTGHKVTRYDELSVTVKYDMGASSVTIPLVQGAAFVVAECEAVQAELVTINAIVEVKDETGKVYRPQENPTIPGSKFLLKLNNGHYWVVYFDSSVSLLVSNNAIKTAAKYTGAVKFAVMAEESVAATLDEYRNAHAVSAAVDYSVSGNSGRILYRWTVKGAGKLLMLALPHHLDTLVSPKKVNVVKHTTIRGTVVGIEGKLWTMNQALPRYVWDSPTAIEASKLPEIKIALESDYKYVPDAKDPYFFGVQIGRLAKLALIADQIGDTEKAAFIRSTMEKAMEPWLEGTNPDSLLYDTTYGGIVSKDGIAGPNNDFGQGYYNDHHFHYGYHVMACAVIGRKNPSFVAKYKDVIVAYAREYANPSDKDTFFTVTRNKDWFGWHSWAAGLFEFADGRNQESTSEAIMSYYGLMLLGEVLGNTEMNNFGKLMLAMEITSTKKYWHMPTASQIYPEVFKNNKMVGIVWGTKVDYATFFGKNDLFIHGIQMLPFLPPTEACLDKTFIIEEYQIIKNQNTPADWSVYRICARAIIEKEAAWTEALVLKEFHTGTCRTIMLHWIATRPNIYQELM